MRVFVAGATGAVGRPLVRRLLQAGHEVAAMTRSPERAAALRERGVDAVVADALDAEATTRAIVAARPEVVVHQLTEIPARMSVRRLEQDMAPTSGCGARPGRRSRAPHARRARGG